MDELRFVIEKLKDIISEGKEGAKVFDKDVASALAIPQATFATMKKRNSVPYKEIMEFCAIKKLSINWIFFDQAIDMLALETDKYFQIRYFPDVRASAGGGAFNFDDNYKLLSIDSTIMQNIVLEGNQEIEAITVDGESMEPTLQDGSIVFIDRSQTNINKNGIFIVEASGGLFIKRIRQRADGMVELLSENTLYPPEPIHPDAVTIVGKVVGNIESL